MKTAADRFEEGLRLFYLGVISAGEIKGLANDARMAAGLDPFTDAQVILFYGRLARTDKRRAF